MYYISYKGILFFTLHYNLVSYDYIVNFIPSVFILAISFTNILSIRSFHIILICHVLNINVYNIYHDYIVDVPHTYSSDICPSLTPSSTVTTQLRHSYYTVTTQLPLPMY